MISPRCNDCLDQVLHTDQAWACTSYEGVIKDLIHAYKYKGRKYLGHFFSELLASFFDHHLSKESFNALAAIPLHPIKKRQRGFNQSELICHALSKQYRIKDASTSIRRIKNDTSQSLLGKIERREHVLGSFYVPHANSFVYKKVLLIDDILTTGQTASECARILKLAGAVSVKLLVIARGVYR